MKVRELRRILNDRPREGADQDQSNQFLIDTETKSYLEL